MSYKILFLESEIFYLDIFDPFFFSGCDVEFDGGVHYRNISYYEQFDLIVYTIYSSPIYNVIIQNCIFRKVDTMLLFDGICEFSNFTNNKQISKLGIDNYHPIIASNIVVVGNEAMNYFRMYCHNVYKHLPPRVLSMKTPIVASVISYDFLITTANTAYFNDIEKTKLVEILHLSISKLKANNHSYCFRIFDQELIDDLNIDATKNYTSGSFESVLAIVKCVITTPSSILLSSMYYDKSVALLLYRDSPLFVQSGWLIHLGVDFPDIYTSMLERDEKRLSFQKSQLLSNTTSTRFLDIKNIKPSPSFTEVEAKFLDQNMMNVLNSPFNFNVEHRVRKIYWFLKSKSLLKFFKPILNLFN